jgi:hypothetical protein
MVKILAGIDDDDDATTAVPGQRKRRMEDDPEQLSTVPEGVENNPMAPTKRRKKDQIQAPPLLPLKPVHPAQIPPRHVPQPRSNTSTQLVPLPVVSQPHASQSAPRHQPQPQPNQTTTCQSSTGASQQHHNETSAAAFETQANLNEAWNDDLMSASGDKDVNVEDMAVDHDEDEYFPQESQLPSDDIYGTPPPPPRRRIHRKYVGSDDQPQQLESPQLRPEGYYSILLIDFLLSVYL